MANAVASFRSAISNSSPQNGIASLAFKELRSLEEIVKDSTPFASLDLYIRNQKQFEDAYQAFSAVERFNGSTLLPACRRAGGNDFGEQSQSFRAAHGSDQSLFFESIHHRHILLFAGQKDWQRIEQSLMWS